MINRDWNIFRAKFSENPQDNFEWFCYILFCKEFEQEKGIFGFKNQSGMEKNPIKVGNDWISHEAKFYDTEKKLADNKNELKSKIDIVKKKNPEVTKLYFYTPIDWTESNNKEKRKTKAQKEVEKHAKSKEIKIIWKGDWFFKSPFVCSDNKEISKHFFTQDKSIFDLIEQQEKHNQDILDNIQDTIIFQGQNVEIKRIKEQQELEKIIEKKHAIVISGQGGIGKSVFLKSLYEKKKKETPVYLFRTYDLKINNINQLFENFSLEEFIDAHDNKSEKIVVIDAAEKLGDLKNQEIVKDFLRKFAENNWTLIFTARDRYVNDLLPDFFETYRIPFFDYPLNTLSADKIRSLSKKHSFQLPKDEKIFELIKNPFYLSEYLKNYKIGEKIDYKEFKNKLWEKNITKNSPPRSDCFQKIAFSRSKLGNFFITPNYESSILNELIKDGILGHEDDKGYFITHDIYEEWALEKIISKEFFQKDDNQSFFNKIGQSLSIRRSFRNWITEQLLLENDEIKNFIEEVIDDKNVSQSWKNEMIVSILLSDYSDYFFNNFGNLLLVNNQKLLKRTTFWLRIACKEIDDDFFNQLGINSVDLSTLEYVLTKPKGNGWKSVIKFAFDNLETIGIENIYFILPVINDWNSKFKKGKTTRFSGLIALKYYQWIIEKNACFSLDDDAKEQLFKTILNGSFEIKDELKKIFEEILKNKWKNHKDPYYDLLKTILTKLEGVSASQALPEYILQLADLFWTYTPRENDRFHSSGIDIEEKFGIENYHQDYYPVSSYQTPIYWLLQSAQKETIDFILQFTNKTVEIFSKSEFAKYEVEEIEVFIDNKTTIRQYISNRLWCTYRGTQGSSQLLESMHMALEKFFLERGENTKSETLEYWLMYLLKNSKSASISAVAISIVLAFPDKTFNVAKILFQTKKFFLYEMSRWILDQQQKSQLLMLKNSLGSNSKDEIHQNERLKACDDTHRKWQLENQFLHYQVFRNKNITKKEVKKRQKIIWGILDNYYQRLPKESKQTEADKTWRMFLARMDYRKMKPATKKTKEGIEIHWNPEIDPQLKKGNEKFLKKSSKPIEHVSLKMWAYYRMKNEDEYKKYDKYEKNPKIALKEIKEIISKLKTIKKPQRLQTKYAEDENFYLLNYSIPGEVCVVLIKYFLDKLSQKDIEFCKDIILDVASSSLKIGYQYQISDGVQSAISILPSLIDQFPKEKHHIKNILLIALLDDHPIGMAGKFNHYSINTIHKLWENNFQEAQSLMFGYLSLKPKYKKLKKKLREENQKKEIYELHESQVIKKFTEEYENNLQKISENKIFLKDCKNIEEIELPCLGITFQLIPLKTEDNDHKKIVKKIVFTFAEKLISDDRDDKVDYMVRRNFLEKLAYFVLNAKQEEVEEYIKPFVDNFNNSKIFSDLLTEFILAEDQLNTYDNFWIVWNLFKDKIIEICKKGDQLWYTKEILKSYLFATVSWKKSTISWHTLKDKNKKFFKEISQEVGHCPSALYSISKLLTDIGNPYLDDGILWISKMLKDNKNLYTAKLETSTIYYLEKNIRKYIYKNREEIKKTKKLKEDVLVVLDFLVEKGSVVGYMLRENIL